MDPAKTETKRELLINRPYSWYGVSIITGLKKTSQGLKK